MTAAPIPGANTGLVAPVAGSLVQITEVKDDAFSQKCWVTALHRTNDGAIAAPADGTIISLTNTKHAFTLKTGTGLELLVHLGLDTVELGGVPFSFDIQPGQQVISGQQIGTMDLQQIKDAGKDTTVITVITNMDAVANVTEYYNGPVDVGAPVLQVRNK